MAKSPNASAGAVTAKPTQSLPAGNQTGATVDVRYFNRRQDYVSVNRNDLEDLRDFDSSAVSFGAIGMFLLSGAVWLLLEKLLTEGASANRALVSICSLSILVGAFLIWQGGKMHKKKTNRINRIFEETEPFNPSTSGPR